MKTNIVLTKNDFDLLSGYVNNHLTGANYTIKKLFGELKNAKVIEEDIFRKMWFVSIHRFG